MYQIIKGIFWNREISKQSVTGLYYKAIIYNVETRTFTKKNKIQVIYNLWEVMEEKQAGIEFELNFFENL